MRHTPLLIPLLTLACHGDPQPDAPVDDTAAEEAEPFDVYRSIPTEDLPPVRGWRVTRGEMHVHTPYSHDACDGKGFVDAEGNADWAKGTRDEQCFQELRAGVCESLLDWVFFTDHNAYLRDFELEETIQYQEGDTLERDGDRILANHLACADGRTVLGAAGVDTKILGLGMETQPASTSEERAALYSARDQSTLDGIRRVGGLATAGYVPDWDEDELLSYRWDAIEVYNPKHNLQDRMTDVLALAGQLLNAPETVPVPELVLYAVLEENTVILDRWAKMAQTQRTPSFLGVNAHRNVLPGPTEDGERIDSFRRNFHWFANYALLPEGDYTMADVKDAVRDGRTYGSYDAIGTPAGFDYHAEADGEIFEMGREIALDGEVLLRVISPEVAGLGPDDTRPEITSRIVRAEADGTWREVAAGPGTVEFEVTEPGAYRAEVRILPHHLVPFLGNNPEAFLEERLWVYGNLIYVGMDYAGE